MSIRTAIIPVGLVLLLAACNINRSEDAMKLSNRVAAVNDSLTFYGKQWNDELEIAVNAKDFSHLPEIRGAMQDYIQRRMVDVRTMHDVGGSEDLRNAELGLLQFDQDSILPKLTVFEGFDNTVQIEPLSNAYSALWGSFKNEQPRLKLVDTLMNKYADANDFPKRVDPFPANPTIDSMQRPVSGN